MSHHKSSKPNRASKTKVKCNACGKWNIPERTKREPPGHGVVICDDKACRAKVQEKARNHG